MKKQVMILLAILVPVFATITKAQDTLTRTQNINTQNNVTNTTIVAEIDDDDARDNFHFGIKAGANFTNVYDRQGDDFSSDTRVGFVGGVFLQIPLGTFVGIQPELLYSQKGYTAASGTFLGINYNYSRRTSYLDLPIYLQIKPSPMVSIVLGPQFSFLINNNDVFEDDDDDIEDAFDDITLRSSTLGLAGGLDINLYPLVISGRVGFDLQDVHDNTDAPRYRNMWFQLTGGIAF